MENQEKEQVVKESFWKGFFKLKLNTKWLHPALWLILGLIYGQSMIASFFERNYDAAFNMLLAIIWAFGYLLMSGALDSYRKMLKECWGIVGDLHKDFRELLQTTLEREKEHLEEVIALKEQIEEGEEKYNKLAASVAETAMAERKKVNPKKKDVTK